jgi:hypothetical protein
VRKIVLLLMFFISIYADGDYELGSGKQVGSLPLYVGGYFSLDYRNMANEKRYRADDIAILGYGSYDKLSYMAEFEYKEFYLETYVGDTKTIQKDTQLHSERVYLDYNFNENYVLRAGKYNSSIGFWNLLPINVLRQTTSNPISSNIVYPKFTTGTDISYTSYDEGELKINLTLQNNKDLDAKYNNYEINKHYGIGALYERDDYSVKINGGYFHRMNVLDDKLYYFMLSAKYETEEYELLGEIGYQQSQDRVTTPYAGYIQGSYHFAPKHVGIIRFESYEDKINVKKDDIGVVGYTYRPSYPVAIKSEYQFHSISRENQFLFSVSVLF